MAYEPTIWKDRVVEKPRTFNIVNNPDGTVTLVPALGVVVEEGTPVNAANLNKLEQGLKTHEADDANPHAVTKEQVGLGSVENYGIATKAEAEAGTSNAKYMTPIRVKEAIDVSTIQLYNNTDIKGTFYYKQSDEEIPANQTRTFELGTLEGVMNYFDPSGSAVPVIEFGPKIYTVLRGVYCRVRAFSSSYFQARPVVIVKNANGATVKTVYGDWVAVPDSSQEHYHDFTGDSLGSLSAFHTFKLQLQVKNMTSSEERFYSGNWWSGIRIDGVLPLKGIE